MSNSFKFATVSMIAGLILALGLATPKLIPEKSGFTTLDQVGMGEVPNTTDGVLLPSLSRVIRC